MNGSLKAAFISDVHANLEALEAVLDEIGDLEIYCIGDFVDYGANPNEVVRVLKERGVKSVLGNHDYAALTGDDSGFNPSAAISSRWTRSKLAPDCRGFLEGLPRDLRLEIGGRRAYLVHGSPDDPLWEYVDPSTHHLLFGHYLGKLKVETISLGHTHIPYVWKESRGIVFNPGSVGQPRDGDWRASYAVVTSDSDKTEVEVRRVEYEAQVAAAKIIEAGLPKANADRLMPRSDATRRQ